MLNRMLSCGLLAGLAVGILAAMLQLVLVTPLIIEAERYETAPAEVAAHDHAAGGEAHAHGGWMPADGIERASFTTLATVASTIGFALMLVAAAAVTPGGLDVGKGLGFGLAGFAATGLATGLGLAPELPGAAAADLVARQAWWLGTALATAAGLAAIAYGRPAVKTAGLLLLAAPHLLGAPEAVEHASAVPAELSAMFAARALALQAMVWAALGIVSGWLWTRLDRTSPATAGQPA